jgi:ribose 5-phosphate isomerase A
MATTADSRDGLKRTAAERAVDRVTSGMRVGLGTGSTAIHATRKIGELLRDGALRDVVGFPTSKATWAEARALGIPLLADDDPGALDITIDGADEVDPELNVIKGGGGALLREKIVAQASRRMVVVVDADKLSARLGTRFPLPVEVVPFGWRAQARYLESLGARVDVRTDEARRTFETDQGNLILDCAFGPISDARQLADVLGRRAGIVEHGLFLELATDLIVADADGVRHVQAPRR